MGLLPFELILSDLFAFPPVPLGAPPLLPPFFLSSYSTASFPFPPSAEPATEATFDDEMSPLTLCDRPPITPRQSFAPHRQTCPSWGLKREKL